MRKLKGALIAAGRGDRLRNAGVAVAKPLVPIDGVPLIERVLGAMRAAGIDDIACILNAEPESDAVEAHCRTLSCATLQIVRRTTPSSMESFFALAPLLGSDPFVLLTVDAVFGPSVLPALLAGFADHPEADGVLAVHTFIDDENPLRVRIDATDRITAFGPAAGASPVITAGLYIFHPRIFTEIAAARTAGYSALRQFLAHLCERGYMLTAVTIPKTVDVDRIEDVAVAEEFIRSGFASAG